jgi:hypothetical protein
MYACSREFLRRRQQRRRLVQGQRLGRAALAAVRRAGQRRDVPADEIPAFCVAQGPGEAVGRLLQRRRGMGDRHLRQRGADVLHGQVAQRDPPHHRKDRAERVPVDLDGLGGPAGQALGQPVGNRHIHRVALDGPDASVQLGVQRLELVLDLGPGLAAELLADPLPAGVEAERDHPAPAAGTGLVVGAVPAVGPVVEVDAVLRRSQLASELLPMRSGYSRRSASMTTSVPDRHHRSPLVLTRLMAQDHGVLAG